MWLVVKPLAKEGAGAPIPPARYDFVARLRNDPRPIRGVRCDSEVGSCRSFGFRSVYYLTRLTHTSGELVPLRFEASELFPPR
jgi:hypothetical protein